MTKPRNATVIEVPWPYTDIPALAKKYREGFAAGQAESASTDPADTEVAEIGGQPFLRPKRKRKVPKGAEDRPRIPGVVEEKDFTDTEAEWDGYKDGRRIR